MADFLTKIVEMKRAEVEQAKRTVSETALRVASGAREDYRSFYDALTQPGVNIIAEIKRASPSKGDIDPNLDPAETAKLYEQGGAAALSILTEKSFFKGSMEDMKAARAACNLPVLRKDFVFDPYQLYEASAAYADAVLLIARILDREELGDLIALADALFIDALVEIHDEDDLEKIQGLGAKIVGINNRDLKSFSTNLDIAKCLAQELEEGQIAVAASGIFNRSDIDLYLPDVNCFLIGESIVRASDKVGFLSQLRG